MRLRQFTTHLIVLVLAGSTLSCSSLHVRPGTVDVASFRLDPHPTEYRLRAGDRLALMFLIGLERDVKDEYRLEIGDEIKLTVQEREDLSGAYLVVPDGWLHLPLVAPIRVRGLSLEDARKAIQRAYEPIVPRAEITVSITRFNSRANGFIASLTQGGTQGPVFEAVVELDGTAILPEVGPVKLAGLTLSEANAAAARLYKAMLPGIDVTARIASTRGHVVTVLGEVRNPGAFEIPGLTTLTEAIGLAGGWLPSAHLGSVIVVQPRRDVIHVTRFDLAHQVLIATQVQLAPGDFVWVPRSGIGNLNAWVDQYIRRNLPINVGVGIPVN